MNSTDVILEVKNLCTSFSTDEGEVKAVEDVSFQVCKGRTLGLVGESGCGKTVTSLSIMRLLACPPAKISGEILYNGRDLLKLSDSEMRAVRGNEISMVFQEPMTSLNPVFTIGNQVREAIELHSDLSKKEIQNKAIEVLRMVGIPAPEKRIDDYPHQLSGGMRQRVMIAMALACNPNILIADEPTTALDVTIQAQILELLQELQERVGMAVILITHDLGVVAEVADDVLVMYAGQVVEQAHVTDIFDRPQHPYTQGLLNSIPVLGKKRLEAIPGIVPSLLNLPPGCRFQDRCFRVTDRCRIRGPELRRIDETGSSMVRCILENGEGRGFENGRT